MLPVVLLNLINNDEGCFYCRNSKKTFDCFQILDTSNEDVPPAPEQIPEDAKAELVKMAAWLLDNGRDEYLTVYGKIRGGVLQRSLNSLRNHQRSVSGGSTHGGGAIGSPMLVMTLINLKAKKKKLEYLCKSFIVINVYHLSNCKIKMTVLSLFVASEIPKSH